MSKELELIAKVLAVELGWDWPAIPEEHIPASGEIVADMAAHVVSKLSEHGYSIVPSGDVEFGLATSDDPFIREGIPEQDARRLAARHLNAHVVTRVRGPWVAAAAAEEEKSIDGLPKMLNYPNPLLPVEGSTPHVTYHDVETCDCEVCTAVRE